MDIIIKDLKKTFGEKVAVDIPELTIHSGELLGLVGNNGAGKSTLFRLILDLIKADTGTVHMKDRKVDINVAETEVWKDWTGAFVDESFLIDYLTPDEYFQFIARLTDTSDEQLQEFLAQYQHFNHLFMKKSNAYQAMPGYPTNHDVFRAGLAWHFYN